MLANIQLLSETSKDFDDYYSLRSQIVTLNDYMYTKCLTFWGNNLLTVGLIPFKSPFISCEECVPHIF